ncbi:Gmad2 immunoglobulin-like domain-containing protein [Nocardioides sp. GXZ039]|uniref:Gmad2 immunoglobulin-like domain-containing protein n=1 Tax=Nocardioides sp. GXZ039 TaxID=3136018 RepID=UPI0030F3FE9A
MKHLRTRAAVVALCLPLGLGLLAACGDDEPDNAGTDPNSSSPSSEPSSEPGETTTTQSESPTETEGPSETESPDGSTATVPIYFAGDTPMGTRLYRELRQVPAEDSLTEAARLLVSGDALDPDYRTLLDGVTINEVTEEVGGIVVTLGEDSITSADKGLSPADAKLAVQSLVYTLQGAAGSKDHVEVRLANTTPADLFGQPTSIGVKAAPQLKVLSLVNIGLPEEGAKASGTLKIDGMASSFEATVRYFVTSESGATVVDDSAMAKGWINRLYPWKATIDLSGFEPGTYVLHAQTDDPTGGEGPGPFEDTRTFVVE